MSRRDLCDVYSGPFTSDRDKRQVKAELDRRHAFTADQWSRIQAHDIRVHDPEDLAICALGEPQQINTQEVAVGEGTVSEAQLVYGERLYIYVEYQAPQVLPPDWYITAIQD